MVHPFHEAQRHRSADPSERAKAACEDRLQRFVSAHFLAFSASMPARIVFSSAFVSGSAVSAFALTIFSTFSCCRAFADTDHWAAPPISMALALPLALTSFI